MNAAARNVLRTIITDETQKGKTMNAIAHELQDAGFTEVDATILHNIAATNDSGLTATQNRTFPSYRSEILERSVTFAIERAGSQYLKDKDRARKAHGQSVEAAVRTAQDSRQHFINWLAFIPASWTPDNMLSRFCGEGDQWQAKGQKVQEYAAANGISIQDAADLQGRSLTVAQDYIQTVRSPRRAGYAAWIDACINCVEDGDALEPSNLGAVLTDAYLRAAAYNKPDDGLMIHDFACEQGISDELPTWLEALKKALPDEAAAGRARERIAQRAANVEAAAAEAEDELRQRYGDF